MADSFSPVALSTVSRPTSTEAYKRFLEGRFRKEFNLVGTPLRIEMKSSTNPYADKDDR
jgi:predicted GTPase